MALRSLLGGVKRLTVQDARLAVGAVNGFHTSGKASMGFGSHASDNDPHVLDKEKERNLKGEPQQSKIPGVEHGWNEKLASDSEAAVKSDRHVSHDVPIEELQEHSVKHIRKEHHEEDIVVETDKK